MASLTRSRRAGSVLAGAVAVSPVKNWNLFSSLKFVKFLQAPPCHSPPGRGWRQRSSGRWQSSLASLSRIVGLSVFFADTVLRNITNKPKLNAEVIATRGAKFILHLRKLVREYKIDPQNVIAVSG